MPLCEVARGVELYYEDFGEGPPIVFTSAGNLTHKIWMGQVAGLAPDIRTITYDIRGTGLSTKPRAGYSARPRPLHADRASGPWARHHGRARDRHAHRADGGRETSGPRERIGLAERRALVPRRARRCHKFGVADDFLAFLTGRSTWRSVPANICEEMIGTWLFRNPPTTGVVHALLEQAPAWPQFVLNALSQSMRDVDHRHRLPILACPILIVHGRHDRKQLFVGAAHMAKLARTARLVTLEHSAHMGQLEELVTFDRLLAEFSMLSRRRRRGADC